MQGWLLSTDALLEFLSGKEQEGTPGVLSWAESKGAGKLFVSEISWATARAMAESESDPLKRQDWLDKLDRDAPKTFGARLLPVDRGVLTTWSRIGQQATDKDHPVTIEESLEIATALKHSLVYATKGSELAKRVNCSTESWG